uniref:Uncharacterized protein n=1 Tax=viral metagenome TaxID=1070528 RepID=A0A6M3LR20_9ZZZZ
MVEKKNADYSASAVNLTNHPVVMDLETKYRGELKAIEDLNQRISNAIPQALKDQAIALEKGHQETDKTLRKAIDEYGSYQHVEYGFYAVKQRRESIIYKPELVRQYAPSKVASFVLIESVDSKALDALVKAGQIAPDVARQCGEAKESFAYIIK